MNLKTNVTECKLKVKLLHEKLLEGKCETQIDEFLKKLLIYLWWEDTEDVDRILSIVSEWIVAAVMQWSSSRVTLPTNLISFTLKLAALLLKNENRFNHFNRNNFFIKLVNLSKARQPETDSAVKSAYIEFLSSFLDHQSGVEWIIASNYWEDIFHIYLNNANESLVKESTLFLEKILVKTVDFDEIFCENVIKRIMVPLGENIFRCVKASEDVSDEVAVELLQPILKLMVNLLESLLKGVCFEGKDLGVVLLFLKNFHLEERICDFMIIAQKQCLVLDITKIMFLMQFLELYGKIITKSTTLSKVQDSVARIQKNFITKLHTGSLEEKVDFCDFGLFYWKLMESKIPFCYTKEIRKDEAHFTDQLVFCLMMPGCCVLIKYLICSMTEWEEMFSHDDFRDSFVQKMFNLVSTDFTRVLFSWRESLMNCQDIFEICVLSLELIKKSSNYLSRNQAVMVFQCYIYFLNDVILVSNKFPEKLNIFVEKFSYLVEIFKIVGFLIENFQIVLKDGIEATYVLATCFDFLGLTEWPWQVMAQVLKLIDIATAHYMSPNMALLVENTTDSTVALLGPLLYSKIIDKTPEVKKAALEVVCTAAGISSNSKF